MSLHKKIMNLPCGVADTKVDAFKDYAQGHRDARQAAAELAVKQDAVMAQLLEALQMVATSGKFQCFDDGAWDAVNAVIARATGQESA